MSTLQRLMTHACTGELALRRSFPPATLAAIEQAVRDCESRHAGEIRFAVEPALRLAAVWQDQGSRQRALAAFAELGVWDTAHNNGVLIYVLLADRQVEILADRGINRRVGEATWQAICRDMETAFRDGRFHAGALAGVQAISQVLTTHFPAHGPNPDELPNAAIIL